MLNDLLDEVIVGMDKSLVGKFLAFRLNMDEVKKWTHVAWKLKGSVSINGIANGLICLVLLIFKIS